MITYRVIFSKMPDFDGFSLLEFQQRKPGSHGIRQSGNYKHKNHTNKRANTTLKCLSKVLKDHGRHSMLSFLSSMPISVIALILRRISST